MAQLLYEMLALVAAVSLAAPALRADAYQGAPPELRVLARPIAAGLGIRCQAGLYAVNATPVRQLKSHLGPPTYLVADADRHGVPQLDKSDLQMVKTIARYVHHPKTLRFGYLGKELIVYDAVDGPCSAAAPGYQVLNVHSCNTGYMPGDVDNATTTALPDCLYPVRPWIVHDRGQGSY